MPSLGTQALYYGGKQLPNPVAGMSGHGAPPSNVSADAVIGQTTYTNMTSQAVYMLTSKNPVTWSIMSTGDLSGYPITPYVVGLAGVSGYRHIQEVIDDIKTQFGAHVIYVQAGLEAEDLDFTGFTFPCNVHIRSVPMHAESSIDGVAIIGNITPPTTGRIFFENVNLFSTTGDIFGSSEAGESLIWLRNCAVQCVSGGYVFNLPNWTSAGKIVVEGMTSSGTGDATALINNTGGCEVQVLDSNYVGTSTGGSSTLSGITQFRNSLIYSPMNFVTGSTFDCDDVTFYATTTLSNNSTGTFDGCRFYTGATAAMTMSSSAAVNLFRSTIDTSNSPAIAGSGAGTLSIGDVSFARNSVISGTLTTSFVTTRGIYQVSTSSNTAGASPQVVNARNGQVIFTDTIANGAYATLTLTNSLIASTSLIQCNASCTTVNSAVNVVGIVPGSGSVALRIYNAGAASTAANILVTFSVLN